MRFSKIKYSESAKKLSLEWTEERGSNETLNHSLSSGDQPRPELLTALGSLKPFVIEICELGEEWGESIRVTGVSVSEKEDVRGLVITATRSLELTSAPLAINTPHLVEDNWPDGLVDVLDTLEQEATAFVKGQRAQAELFEQETEDEPATAGAGAED